MEGVETKDLKIFRDERGAMVSFRADDEIFNGKFGQALVSFLYPDVIKGLHLHKSQTDFAACIKGTALYVAVKENKNGNEIETFIIGEDNPLLIKVSPGIWHGYKALEKEAIMMHTMDEMYDSSDTEKKDPFYFGDLWRTK
ncbi:MAG: dTDP-4-dehydrorhamnose 3,5-epimerase family protein [Candidatus Pacearchaeota archaeon]|nr:dTDP-4-dehydrorhamnose 3,5-epimerase family protein [Candidatus Pacearchaeota archaeon]